MSELRISLVHQINPSFAQNAALAFAEANLLHQVITPIAYNPDDSFWQFLNLLPESIRVYLRDELSRRKWLSPNNLPIQTYPWQEILRILLSRTRLVTHLGISYTQLVDWVYTGLDQQVAKHHLQGLDAIYTYEDLAATTFQVAKKTGIICLYDLPIPYYQMTRKIMEQEAERFPHLAPSIQSIQDPEHKLRRKQQELHLADHIFVASSITKQSLLEQDISSDKITIIPYGAPVEYFHPKPKPDDCFRALFVGRVSPRKGVHYLLQAWQELKLDNSELLLVGTNLFPNGWLEQYKDIHRHVPSIPHFLLNKYYTSASIFVFPSLVEGFGLVLLEAMACGIPIITTSNTAGPDIITDGIEGFIINIRNLEALKEKIEWCYQHPEKLAEMGQAARRKAEQLNWQQYRHQLSSKVYQIFHNSYQ